MKNCKILDLQSLGNAVGNILLRFVTSSFSLLVLAGCIFCLAIKHKKVPHMDV